MPVTSFLSSLTDKAQNAINASPLAGHLPSGHRPGSPDQPSANQAAAQGGTKSHALESIQYQLRAFGQQYSSTSPVQKIITGEKGVALDFDSVSRDAKAQSKELYTWGQSEAADLRDVTDRLAYLNFVQGSLAGSLAVKLDSARTPLKALRDAEASLAPRRNIRAGLQTQIGRIEHDQQKGMEKRLAELREQLKKAEAEDESLEKEVELTKRKAVRDSEQLKWDALREYGEKLVLLAQASTPMVSALPTLPPSASQPYTGGQATAAARASLQRALDNYKTGHINLPPQSPASELSRSDTRSFGETHASELSSLSDDASDNTHPGLPVTPPPTSGRPEPVQLHDAPVPQQQQPPPSSFKSDVSNISTARASSQSPPINTQALNNSPAAVPIPPSASSANSQSSVVAPDPVNPSTKVPSVTPTVAETGVPVSAGAEGPGPASGSLHDIKAASPSAGPRSGGLPGNNTSGPGFGQSADAPKLSQYESADDEKKRLQREERERVLGGQLQSSPAPMSGSQPTSSYPTAEEEKKRLEREERERVLREGGRGGDSDNQGGHDTSHKEGGEEDLPPYQDIQ